MELLPQFTTKTFMENLTIKVLANQDDTPTRYPPPLQHFYDKPSRMSSKQGQRPVSRSQPGQELKYHVTAPWQGLVGKVRINLHRL
jgi:hypothetical protein